MPEHPDLPLSAPAGEPYRGYIPSKRVYFYGLRLHLVVDDEQFVYEWVVVPGSSPDVEGWAELPLALPPGAEGIGDKSYLNHQWEDDLAEAGIRWNPLRRRGDRRRKDPWEELGKQQVRRLVETVGSVLAGYWGKQVRAVTPAGILLKLGLAIMSYDLHRLVALLQ